MDGYHLRQKHSHRQKINQPLSFIGQFTEVMIRIALFHFRMEFIHNHLMQLLTHIKRFTVRMLNNLAIRKGSGIAGKILKMQKIDPKLSGSIAFNFGTVGISLARQIFTLYASAQLIAANCTNGQVRVALANTLYQGMKRRQ